MLRQQKQFSIFYFANRRSSLSAVQKRPYLPHTLTKSEVNLGQKLMADSGNQRSTSGQPAFHQRSTSGHRVEILLCIPHCVAAGNLKTLMINHLGKNPGTGVSPCGMKSLKRQLSKWSINAARSKLFKNDLIYPIP